jgi:hypothetical protein
MVALASYHVTEFPGWHVDANAIPSLMIFGSGKKVPNEAE